MDREAFAAMLNGRKYGSEITREEEILAHRNKLLVVFGHSDDNLEFRGLFSDEIGAYGGASVLVHQHGVLYADHRCDCDYCGFKVVAKQCLLIQALWCKGPCVWTFKTESPYSTFSIMEHGDLFCVGMVIDGRDVPKVESAA